MCCSTNILIKIFYHSLDHGVLCVNFIMCVLKLYWLQKDNGGISAQKILQARLHYVFISIK